MKNVLIPKIEKQADINVKGDFTTNVIQEKIISECHNALPLLKDAGYSLVVKNKDMDSGDLFGMVNIQLPSVKKPDYPVKLNIPIFIKDYKMSPIDTIVMDKVAFPISDGMIKELISDPENFRPITMKEMKQSRILSKLAEADADNLNKELDVYINETQDESQKLLAMVQKRGIEDYQRQIKAAEEFTEPLLECILEKNASNDFDLYSTQLNNNKLEFVKDTIEPKTAKLFLETIGYNEKVAEKATTKKGLHLKAPVSKPNENHESLMYDPSKIDKIKMVEQLETGPVEIMDESGNKLEGVLYELQSFTNSPNAFAEGKLFLDYDKNYCIEGDFQGLTTENEKNLTEDAVDIGQKGVFVDELNDIAYGPVTVKSLISSEDSVITVKYKNKQYNVKPIDGLKRNVIDGDTIMIPKSYNWYVFKREIKIINNPGENVANKFASSSYTIKVDPVYGEFKVAPLKNQSKIASIPTEQHLKLFLSRINLITDSLDKVAEAVKNGKTITFITDYPMDVLYNTATKQEKKASEPLQANHLLDDYVTSIKTAAVELDNFFNKLFLLAREPDLVEILDQTAADIDLIDENLPVIKEASTFDTLDTIFSLNVVNNANTNIFLNSIDKLKSTLSLLSALRVYIRLGWQADISEADITQAVDALLDITKSLELIKTERVLDRQDKNKI